MRHFKTWVSLKRIGRQAKLLQRIGVKREATSSELRWERLAKTNTHLHKRYAARTGEGTYFITHNLMANCTFLYYYPAVGAVELEFAGTFSSVIAAKAAAEKHFRERGEYG